MPNQVISTEDVLRIAHLSRLTLHDGEIDTMKNSLVTILEHLKKVKEMQNVAVQPTCHPRDSALQTDIKALREDMVLASLPIDNVLQNAPERIGDAFGVPKMIE